MRHLSDATYAMRTCLAKEKAGHLSEYQECRKITMIIHQTVIHEMNVLVEYIHNILKADQI